MKQFFAALLALCILSLAGCGQPNTPPVEPPAPSQAEQPAAVEPESAPVVEPEAPGADESITFIEAGGLAIPVPPEYVDLLVIDTEPEAWNEHWTPLVSFSEKASVEAGMLDHPDEDRGDGMLCTISRLDRIGFEDWASGEQTGTRLFARDGGDFYYLITQPTDVRLYRAGMDGGDAQEIDGLEGWAELNSWAEMLPDAIVERNGLTAYDAADLFDVDYTYGGEHVELGCRFPGRPMDLVILSLSQPAKQGEGGIWCVERVREVYSDYNFTDMHLVFPAALGIDETAADYYARLQSACDAGEQPELLTPPGAALDYARSDAVKWLFGEDVSATDFEVIEALG